MSDNVILRTKVGSHMWGTNTAGSDHDYRAVVFTPFDAIFDPFATPKKSVQRKVTRPDGTEADETQYELLHFCRLAAKGNPTLMEVLYSPLVEDCTYHGNYLRCWRHHFVGTRQVYESHRGFVTSQLREAQKPQPSRPRGKLLSSAIIGCRQAEALLHNPEAADFGRLLGDKNDVFWYRPEFHISLKTEDKHHDMAMSVVEWELQHLAKVYANTPPREPCYDGIASTIRDMYVEVA